IAMELLNSFKSICVYIALDIVVFDIAEIGVFQKYNDVALYGWFWFWASIPVAIILHDAYFYWMHRAMHHPKLYKIFHLTHHRSHNPTPFTAYSFAAPEAAVQYAFVPLLLLVMPIHSVALLIVLAIMILKNAVGHCGYELFPRGFAEHPFWGQFTTVTHHDMHHERARGNYGFYFTWWDRWMGTEQADYQTRFARVTQPESQHGVSR
ncbi:MAG: sterol desaturase family protein, partial [Terricaulis sp.]